MRSGLPDPVFDAQAVFRAVLGALSRPGLPHALPPGLAPPAFEPPAPLAPELAAVALCLADGVASLWLDAPLRGIPDVAAYLRFHTGAPIMDDPAAAAFALVRDPGRCPPLDRFALGSPDDPDRSTTLVLAVDDLAAGATFRLAGPGVDGEITLQARPLPERFPDQLAANRRLFPRGVDILLVGAGQVVGLPRSSRVLPSLAEAA